MTFYKWSQIAAADATADASINWQEGQAPSSINDSARAMMAAMAKYRDDISGSIATGGASTAYTVSSFQGFDSLTRLNGQTIAFTPHVSNGAAVTLNVDGLGAKPLRSAPATELLAGMLVQGTPYVALYNNTDQAFYLSGIFGNPFNIPLAGGMDYWGAAVPNSCFAFPIGQAISRTTYAALFAIMGTTYGAGDGATTFNLPDKTGRVSAMKEAAATRLTATCFGGNSANIGAVGGSESHSLVEAEIPSHQHDVFLKDPGHGHLYTAPLGGQSSGANPPGNIGTPNTTATSTTGITIGSVNGVANDNKTAAKGGSGAHNNVQPTIICNYIIRII